MNSSLLLFADYWSRRRTTLTWSCTPFFLFKNQDVETRLLQMMCQFAKARCVSFFIRCTRCLNRAGGDIIKTLVQKKFDWEWCGLTRKHLLLKGGDASGGQAFNEQDSGPGCLFTDYIHTSLHLMIAQHWLWWYKNDGECGKIGRWHGQLWGDRYVSPNIPIVRVDQFGSEYVNSERVVGIYRLDCLIVHNKIHFVIYIEDCHNTVTKGGVGVVAKLPPCFPAQRTN